MLKIALSGLLWPMKIVVHTQIIRPIKHTHRPFTKYNGVLILIYFNLYKLSLNVSITITTKNDSGFDGIRSINTKWKKIKTKMSKIIQNNI